MVSCNALYVRRQVISPVQSMPRKGGDSGRRPRSEATATKAVAYFVLTIFRIDIYGVFRNGNLTGRPPISTSGLLRFATGHSTCSFVAVTPQASTLIREGKPPPRIACCLAASGVGYFLGPLSFLRRPEVDISLGNPLLLRCFVFFGPLSFPSVIRSFHAHFKATCHSLQSYLSLTSKSLALYSHHARSILGFGSARCWVGECLAIPLLRTLSSSPQSKAKCEILILVRTRTTVIETSLIPGLLLKRINSAWSIFRVQPPRHLRSQRISVTAMAMLLPSALHVLASPIL